MNSVQNESTEPIRSVEVRLTRAILLNAKGSVKTVRTVVCKESFGAVRANQSFVGKDAKRMAFKLPLDLKPDTNSQCVSCRHEISVVFVPGKH